MPALAVVKSKRSLDARGPELNYVPALDGIRAIAVIVIMGYHGGLFLTNGGLLLARHVLRSLRLSHHDAARRRMATSWPDSPRSVLGASCPSPAAGTSACSWWSLSSMSRLFSAPGTYGGLRLDAFSTLFYVANWHFILIGSNYFGHTGPDVTPAPHVVARGGRAVLPVLALVVIAVLRTRLGLRLLSGCLYRRSVGLSRPHGGAVLARKPEPRLLRNGYPSAVAACRRCTLRLSHAAGPTASQCRRLSPARRLRGAREP